MEYSAFEHLAKALFVGKWRDAAWAFMSVIDYSTAYFDESRVDQSHKFPVVAGFFNTFDMWEVFEKKWREASKDILDRDIKKYFRHRPSANNSAEDEKRYRDALVLASVMRDYAFWAIYITIERALFQPIFDALADKQKLAPLLSSAYSICSFSCCMLLDELAGKKQLRQEWTPIKVVFDKGNENQRWLERGYDGYYASQPSSFLKKTAAFEDDDGLIPLRAADAYAWLLARKYNENEELDALKLLHERGRGLLVEKRELTGEEGKRVLQVIESQREESRKKAKGRNA